MIIQYGYMDGTGEYFISIDDIRCDGCKRCINTCPEDIFEIYYNEFDNIKVKVRDEKTRKIGYICSGIDGCGKCTRVCKPSAIDLSW
jgi:ferredoxin